ncbi:MAG: NUDIX hydrolase [Bacteroidales bacterium]|nr:NUDIX hydrolase [Bacteroidales bacterium]
MQTNSDTNKTTENISAVSENGSPLYCYRYPHAALTADCVVFGFDNDSLHILLIQRGLPPFKGEWALPGGFMKIDESIEATAERELFEETGLKGIFMEQFKVYSRVDRDPRERVVTVAFIALVKPAEYKLVAGDDAINAKWFNLDNIPTLAFDHADIIRDARKFLAKTIRTSPLAFRLLDEVFSLSELQAVYEAITGKTFDRRNFARKATQSGLMKEVTPPAPIDSSLDDSIKTPSGPAIDALDFFKSHGNMKNSALPHNAAPRPKKAGRQPSRFFSFTFAKKGKESEDKTSTKDIFEF